MKLPVLLFCFILLTSNVTVCEEDDGTSQKMAWDTYRKLLEVKHKSQQIAMKTLYGLDSQEKVYKMLEVMLGGIFKVISEGQQKLVGVGYLPGDFVPEDTTIKEALSSVLENTVFFSELMLRFPDPAHQLFDVNRSWNSAIKWCILFIDESNLLEGTDADKAIELVSQEINLVPRSPSYVNPFTKKNMMKYMEKEGILKDSYRREKKKMKKTQKGPRLSRTEL